MSSLRLFLPLVLAGLVAAGVLFISDRRGLQAPALLPNVVGSWLVRRGLAGVALALVLFFAVFSSLGTIGLDLQVDYESLPTWRLFSVQLVMLAGLAVWFVLGFAGVRGVPARDLPALAWRQFGLGGARWPNDLGLGVLFGVVGWGAVLGIVTLVAVLAMALGVQSLLPERPPEMILWIVGLPWLVRLAIAATAGVVEEAFFRGFLQPRIGIAASTVMFALAHVSYGEPFLLVGVLLLSLGFGLLTEWRRNIRAAIVAHFLFDAIQLLVVIPIVVRWSGMGSELVLHCKVLGL